MATSICSNKQINLGKKKKSKNKMKEKRTRKWEEEKEEEQIKNSVGATWSKKGAGEKPRWASSGVLVYLASPCGVNTPIMAG